MDKNQVKTLCRSTRRPRRLRIFLFFLFFCQVTSSAGPERSPRPPQAEDHRSPRPNGGTRPQPGCRRPPGPAWRGALVAPGPPHLDEDGSLLRYQGRVTGALAGGCWWDFTGVGKMSWGAPDGTGGVRRPGWAGSSTVARPSGPFWECHRWWAAPPPASQGPHRAIGLSGGAPPGRRPACSHPSHVESGGHLGGSPGGVFGPGRQGLIAPLPGGSGLRPGRAEEATSLLGLRSWESGGERNVKNCSVC